MMARAPLTPDQRADAAHARQAREIERVRLKRLNAHAMDERLNTAGHPLQAYSELHSHVLVDESGAPALRDIVIRWLDSEPSQRGKLVEALYRLNQEHKRLYRVVNALIAPVEIGMNKPTVRVLAAQLGMSKTTVQRAIHALRIWLCDQGFS